MKKARIALIIAGIAVVMLSLLYVVATGRNFSPAASTAVLVISMCCLEAAAILRVVDDRRSGKSVTAGVVIAVAIAVMAISALIEG